MLRQVDLELLIHDAHYPRVVDCVARAQRSVWIATANLKELMVQDARLQPGRRRARARYRSMLEIMEELASRHVELRILHATAPSKIFRRDFDRCPGLVRGGLALRECPRNHLKLVIVDGQQLYLGSANWTGAGLGAKNEGRRNFEMGLLSEDERLLDAAQSTFDELWRGAHCATCRLHDVCPMPLAELHKLERAPPPPPRARVRLRPA